MNIASMGGVVRLFFLNLVIVSFAQFLATPGRAEAESPKTGKKAAQKFFQRDPAADASDAEGSRDHFLALHIGGFLESTAYKWGRDERLANPAKVTIGVTYRIGEWSSLMDLLLRVDFNSYELTGGRAVKMSILPMVLFPEVHSRFPIYFGVGLGPGVYFRQVDEASNLALDYQLVAGVRFFNVMESTGFFAEAGMKNHVHLLGLGQLNSSYFALGVLFSF